MQNYARKAAVSLVAGAALAFGALTPASAQPVVTGGLVNVVINDVLQFEDVNVAVALGIAATLCDVNVNVLAVQLGDDEVTCETATGDIVTIEQN